MKTKIITIFATSVLIITGCSYIDKNSLYQYPFKTAKIEQTIGGITEGKSTTVIKNEKMAREAHVTFHKSTGEIKQDNLFIDTGRYTYNIDLEKKTGTMRANPLYEKLQTVLPEDRRDFLNKIALGMSPDEAQQRTIKPVGTENIAGQTCDVYSASGFGTICLWYSLPIKTNLTFGDLTMGNISVATLIQTDIEIPDSAFEVPAGITIQKIGVFEEPATQQTQQ